MPILHRFKCLNPNCPGLKDKFSAGILFDAMTSPQPECPRCRCIKVEDWGTPQGLNIGNGSVKRMDATLQRMADQHGLTDINNTGGRAAKSHTPDKAEGKYGNLNIMGVEAPVNDSASAAWGSTPYTAFNVPAARSKLPGNRSTMPFTNVTAEHKG